MKRRWHDFDRTKSAGRFSRRRFFVSAAMGALALPVAARAQAPRMRRVAVLLPGMPHAATTVSSENTIRNRLRELRWIEGQTIEYMFGYAHDDARRWEPMILELLAKKPDVLFVIFGGMALIAMKHTKDVPIVFAISSNPEKTGLVASLARPGGNVTGVSTRELELLGKRIELMREMNPGMRRIAMLTNPDSPEISRLSLQPFAQEAGRFGIEVKAYEAKALEDLRPAFDRMRNDQMQGLVNIADAFQLRVAKEMAAEAARLRLTAVYVISEFVQAGGLASYGIDRLDQSRRAADYVDKILRGARPTDLPVQEPTNWHLAINLKAAREQGIKLPQSVLLRANQVIE